MLGLSGNDDCQVDDCQVDDCQVDDHEMEFVLFLQRVGGTSNSLVANKHICFSYLTVNLIN